MRRTDSLTARLLCVALAWAIALAPARPALATDDEKPSGAKSGKAGPGDHTHGIGSVVKNEDENDEEGKFFDLEEKIVTLATKQPQRSNLAPSIVTVITSNQIREKGYRSVAEALRWVPGFYPLGDAAAGDFAFSNFGVRGVNAGARGGSRILKVMIDGQPISFRSTTVNFLGPELVPMFAVDRIEIVRGPGSALYGANAFLGVVNVITRRGSDASFKERHVRVVGTGEIVDRQDRVGGGGQVVAGGQAGNLEAMAAGSFSRYDRSGAQMPQTSPVFIPQLDANRVETTEDYSQPANFYSRIGYDMKESGLGRVTVHGAFQRLDNVTEFQDLLPLPFIGTPPDTTPVPTRQVLNNGFVRVIHEGKWGDQERPIETAVSVAYAAGGPDSDDRFDTGQPSTYFERQYGYESFDLAASVGYQLIPGALHLTAGMDHTADHHQLLTYDAVDRFSSKRTPLQPNDKLTINNTGVYGQAIVEPAERLSMTLGVRLDQNSIYNTQLNGRAGIVYDFLKQKESDPSLALKLLFGSSFQQPSPELLFGSLSQPGDIIGNPELDPQRAYSWESQLAYRDGESRFGASINGFYNEIKDLAIFKRVGQNLRADNAVNLESYGMELEGFGRVGDLVLKAGTSYQRTLRADRERPSPANLFPTREQDLFPRWIVSFGPSYALPFELGPDGKGRVLLSWDNQWVDDRLASTSNVFLNAAPYTLDDYLLSTLTVATTDIHLEALNVFAVFQVIDIFNEQPGDPGFNGVDIPSLGRRYVLTLGLKF